MFLTLKLCTYAKLNCLICHKTKPNQTKLNLIPTRKPNLVLINKKKKNLLSTGFCRSSDHKVKMKGSEKKNDLARELKRAV